ncbi:MAG: hypothetical protein QM765_16895 [Myxococcales bacterium]
MHKFKSTWWSCVSSVRQAAPGASSWSSQLDGRRQRLAQQLHRRLDDGLHLQRAPVLLRAATEGEDLLDQLAGPQRHVADVAQAGADVVVPLAVGQQELGVAQDDAQDVVEVVGDAAGQRAHRLHLLGLVQLLAQVLGFALGGPLLGDVLGDGEQALAAADDQHLAALADLQGPAVGAPPGDGLGLEAPALLAHELAVALASVGRQEADLHRGPAEDLAAVAGLLGEGGIDLQHRPRGDVAQGHHQRAAVEGLGELLLRRLQPLEGQPLLGHVLHDARGADDLPASIALDLVGVGQDVADAAIRPDHAVLDRDGDPALDHGPVRSARALEVVGVDAGDPAVLELGSPPLAAQQPEQGVRQDALA